MARRAARRTFARFIAVGTRIVRRLESGHGFENVREIVNELGGLRDGQRDEQAEREGENTVRAPVALADGASGAGRARHPATKVLPAGMSCNEAGRSLPKCEWLPLTK